ncbi:alpha/beta fold hydrolase [Peredibacter sp. HCB2-198]|uniref:alpha/beta fold hydrolase n=1 Tax=Peredibacter sp. HCB2-198 TaxID=3383025 RepID=UPI0038B5D8A0
MNAIREKIKELGLEKVYPFRSHFLQLEKHNLHYVDEGQGKPILMLHGNPTWSFYYRNLIQTFSPKFRTIVPDHMGCGMSDKPQDYDYSLETHIQNTYQLIRFLGLSKITLIVHDWGGAIGFGLVTRYPELFEKIVILNTAAYPSEHIPQRINLLRQGKFGEWLTRKWNLFAWPATFMTTTKALPKAIKAGYLLPYDSWDNRVAVARFVQDIPMERDHKTWKTLNDIESKLRSLPQPKLILWGGKDFCFNHHFFEKWVEIYPEANAHWFAKAGHYVLEDALDDVSTKIWEFIK